MLYAEQQKIEEQARANAEANYFKKLTELDNALAEAKLTNEAYEAQLNELSEQYARFEPLLQTISRYYALIDYDGRDTLSARISERIEAGDLDEAERLIKAKGAVAEREKQLKELEQLQQFMRKDLAEDCYNLFTICFERFEQDSAEYYICKRAELDTTNVEYQLRAGQFLMVYRAKYDEAEKYFFRALRLAEQQYGKTSGDVATALSELGENYSHKGDYQQALNYLNRSAKISEELRGKESISMAQSHSNLGALYHKMGRSKEAIGHMQEALRLYERLCPETDPQIPQARNNLGNALFQSKQYLEAQKCFEQALKEYTACYGEKHFDVAIVYNNLASIAFVKGRYAEADNLFVKALELFTRILGPQHPRTKQTQKNLEYLRKGIKS